MSEGKHINTAWAEYVHINAASSRRTNSARDLPAAEPSNHRASQQCHGPGTQFTDHETDLPPKGHGYSTLKEPSANVSQLSRVPEVSGGRARNCENQALDRNDSSAGLSDSNGGTSVSSIIECGAGLVSHGEERQAWACTLCPYRTNRHWCLDLHMRAHTGERPYGCGMCSRRFAQTSNLRKHIRTHTGEKPFKCEVCPAAFSTKNRLLNHMRKHVGTN